MFGWTRSRYPISPRAKAPPHPERYEARPERHRLHYQNRHDEIDLLLPI